MLALAAGLGSCSTHSGEDEAGSHAPMEQASFALVHNPTVDIDVREIRHDNFTIQVPAIAEEKTPPPQQQETHFAWSLPSVDVFPPFVGVVVEESAPTDSFVQSRELELRKEQSFEIELTRSELDWPGADQAVLLQWDEPRGGVGDLITNWQIMTSFPGDLNVTAVVSAPAEEFENLGMPDILATFTPRK